jgi:hypothetical protein
MVAVATGRRGKQDVALELAASVLAICGAVRVTLASQPPRIGHIAEQARQAFAAQSRHWTAMALPAARDAVALAPGPTIGSSRRLQDDLAHAYAADLAHAVDGAAAEALADAMDLQTAKDIHPDVAWQRAVAGYGLAKRPMRSFITAALRTPAKEGIAKAAAPMSAVQASAERALVAYAGKIGDCEVQAWSTLALPEAITKAFDPNQPRDEEGQWTEAAGGARRGRPRARVKTKEQRSDGVDELLASTPVESQTASRYATGESRYGTGQRYASQQRYARQQRYGQQQRYAAAAETRYGGQDRYAAAGSRSQDRYALRYAQQTPAQRQRRRIINSLYILGPQQPNETPRAETSSFGLYLPMSNIAGYYTAGFADVTPTSGGEVDFSHVNTYVHNMPKSFGGTVKLDELDTPWDIDEGFVDIDEDQWDDLIDQAKPLWDQVKADPFTYASQLDPAQLGEVFRRAGYNDIVSPLDMQVELDRNEFMRNMEVSRMQDPHNPDKFYYYDEGLTDALADFVVWHEPGILGEDGYEFLLELDSTLGLERIDDTPVPGVMVFSEGLAKGDTPKDVKGRYKVKSTEYHSAFSEFGGRGIPIGKIAMREIHVAPIEDQQRERKVPYYRG